MLFYSRLIAQFASLLFHPIGILISILLLLFFAIVLWREKIFLRSNFGLINSSCFNQWEVVSVIPGEHAKAKNSPPYMTHSVFVVFVDFQLKNKNGGEETTEQW